jgi:hypothetical protein
MQRKRKYNDTMQNVTFFYTQCRMFLTLNESPTKKTWTTSFYNSNASRITVSQHKKELSSFIYKTSICGPIKQDCFCASGEGAPRAGVSGRGDRTCPLRAWGRGRGQRRPDSAGGGGGGAAGRGWEAQRRDAARRGAASPWLLRGRDGGPEAASPWPARPGALGAAGSRRGRRRGLT